jgi:hypothetical protein
MARMIRRFKIDKSELTQEALLTTQDPEIVYEIINGIFYGMERDRKSVDLFEVQTLNDIQIFSIPRTKWKKALEKSLSKMIEIEDYEMCSSIKKAIEALS